VHSVVSFHRLHEVGITEGKLISNPQCFQTFQLLFNLLQNELIGGVDFLFFSESVSEASDVQILPDGVEEAEMDHLSKQEVELTDRPILLLELDRLLQILVSADRSLIGQVQSDSRSNVGGVNFLPKLLRIIQVQKRKTQVIQ